jgi:hypothetical protein
MKIDFIICARTDDTRQRRVPDSIIAICAECNENVWIAPSSQKAIQQSTSPVSKVVCLTCASPLLEKARIEANQEVKLVRAPGAIAELQQALRDVNKN